MFPGLSSGWLTLFTHVHAQMKLLTLTGDTNALPGEVLIHFFPCSIINTDRERFFPLYDAFKPPLTALTCCLFNQHTTQQAQSYEKELSQFSSDWRNLVGILLK